LIVLIDLFVLFVGKGSSWTATSFCSTPLPG
jgi:hypothetical protein